MAVRKMTVDLEARVARFQAGMRGAERSLSSMERQMRQTRRAVVQFVGAYVGIQTLTRGFGAMVRAAAEGEESQARLGAVLRSTGHAAGWSAARVELLATELERTTIRSDNEIRNLTTILATFVNITGDQFEAATRIVVDMAQVMGTDLRSAAVQVGKALNDPIRGVSALREVGVQLSTQQEEQVRQFLAVNDAASAQRVILQELQHEFGGAAEAAGETFAGGLANAKKAWDDFLESLGRTQQVQGPLAGLLRWWTDFWRARELTTTELESWLARSEEIRERLARIEAEGSGRFRIAGADAAQRVQEQRILQVKAELGVALRNIRILQERERGEERITQQKAEQARLQREQNALLQQFMRIMHRRGPRRAPMGAIPLRDAGIGGYVSAPSLSPATGGGLGVGLVDRQAQAIDLAQNALDSVIAQTANYGAAIDQLRGAMALDTENAALYAAAIDNLSQAQSAGADAATRAAAAHRQAAVATVLAVSNMVAGIIQATRGGGGGLGVLGGIASAVGGALMFVPGGQLAGAGLIAGGTILSAAAGGRNDPVPVRLAQVDRRAADALNRQTGPSSVSYYIYDASGNVYRTEHNLKDRSRRDAVERIVPGTGFAGGSPTSPQKQASMRSRG